MMLIGLTGGVGMGKTAVADFLAGSGERLIDTDLLARELVAPEQPALKEIEQAFGPEVLSPDRTLNRAALAKIVFRSEDQRRALEAILHPRIRTAWLNWAEQLRRDGARRAIVVIPLLFETAAEKEFQVTVCVGCSPSTQRRRLTTRGWSNEQIDRRIASQWPIREKMERSDRVVWNEYSLEICHAQVARIFDSLDSAPA